MCTGMKGRMHGCRTAEKSSDTQHAASSTRRQLHSPRRRSPYAPYTISSAGFRPLRVKLSRRYTRLSGTSTPSPADAHSR